MPEGPESVYMSRMVDNALSTNTLNHVQFMRGRYVNHGPPIGFAAFKRALPLKLVKVDSKGKVIFFHFSNGWYMVSKLGMSGIWYVDGSNTVPTWRAEFKSVVFEFGNRKTLIYSDPRSYGTLVFTHNINDIQAEYTRLAPDIMVTATSWNVFWSRLQDLFRVKRNNNTGNKEIEAVLSDQKLLVSGIGNYLKSEIMYAAKISPHRKIADISQAEWRTLFLQAKRVTARMLRALKSNNTDAYEAQMSVYRKEKDSLGNPVKTYNNAAGRTVHWVPVIQN